MPGAAAAGGAADDVAGGTVERGRHAAGAAGRDGQGGAFDPATYPASARATPQEAQFYLSLTGLLSMGTGEFAEADAILAETSGFSSTAYESYEFGGIGFSQSSGSSYTTFYHGISAEFAADIRIGGIDLSAGNPGADLGTGFYMTTSREDALWSASRSYGNNLDVVTFNVPNTSLSDLSTLNFSSADGSWGDFVAFHKNFEPVKLLHGGEPYDLVTGPLFARESSAGLIIPNLDRAAQTSIHTPSAVSVFNQFIVGR